jgi:hypothetical protein
MFIGRGKTRVSENLSGLFVPVPRFARQQQQTFVMWFKHEPP